MQAAKRLGLGQRGRSCATRISACATPRSSSEASATRDAWRAILVACLALLLAAAGLCFTPVGRRLLVAIPTLIGPTAFLGSAARAAVEEDYRKGEVYHTPGEWKKILGDDMAYRVLRQESTERPGSSPLNGEKRDGVFACKGCGSPLYTSSMKYNSGTGWPSFFDVIPGAVDRTEDRSIPFMARTEIRCHKCQGHLGHVFDDGPRPTGLRYCMNGAALTFVPDA